ncbi:MAG: response regulator [Mariprofundaceae bacterium]|nr:response regulator [Mariprofundaceae bacterium]
MTDAMTRARIMIVEDEAIVARDIQLQLEKLGYQVVAIADNYEDAIGQAEAESPDLVLMDIVLDGLHDGIDAAGLIASRFNIPVVYLTAFSDKEKLKRASATEPYGYLVKPFEPRELYSTIVMALFKHAADTSQRQALDESERLNALLLEREFRIKELRDEIAALKQQMGLDNMGSDNMGQEMTPGHSGERDDKA